MEDTKIKFLAIFAFCVITFCESPCAALLIIEQKEFAPANQTETPLVKIQETDDSSQFPPLISPPLEELGREQMQNVVTTLRHAGVFGSVAGVIDGLNLVMLPQGTSIFVPTDAAMMSVATTLRMYIMQYHVVTQRLTFAQLLGVPKGDRLLTLFPGNSVVVTSNERWNFTLDDVWLISPDLYTDSTIVVHGIDGVLNITQYGIAEQNVTSLTPVPEPASSTSSAQTDSPPTIPAESPLFDVSARSPDFQKFLPSASYDSLARSDMPLVAVILVNVIICFTL